MNRSRAEYESFEQYKENMRQENKELKERLKGNSFWDSNLAGTFYKRMR